MTAALPSERIQEIATRIVDIFIGSGRFKWNDFPNTSRTEQRASAISVVALIIGAENETGGASTPSQTSPAPWISVSEKLPETGEVEVWVWNDAGFGEVAEFRNGRFLDGDPAHGMRGELLDLTPRVTHWMPLPSPPPSEGGAASASQPAEK